ncbi:MAG: AMP-binding protein [Flavobacteriales bacterium]
MSPRVPLAAHFRSLTVNGCTMSADETAAHFGAWRGNDDGEEAWREPLERTVAELLRGRGGLSAWTSGTTGPPKRISIPRRDLVKSAELTATTFGLHAGDKALLCLPCDFVAGKMMVVRAFVLGLDLHIIDPRGSILQKLTPGDRFRFTAMVPLQLHRSLQEDRQRVEEHFHTILLGGGPVSDALVEDLQDLRVNVFQSYGSTEMVSHIALRALNGPERSEPFRALGDVHFARDPRGCLVVHTPHLSVKQHLTNDLVRLVDDTRFIWQGRHDNVILSGGKKIFPEQLEARTAGILPYPHYFTAAPDPVLGQAVMLVLETERPQEEVLPEVLELLIRTLHPHELPRRVQALRRIQRTSGGKMIRR